MTTKELREEIRKRYDQGRYTWFYTLDGYFIVKDKTSNRTYAKVNCDDYYCIEKIDKLMEFVEVANDEDTYYLAEMKKFMSET